MKSTSRSSGFAFEQVIERGIDRGAIFSPDYAYRYVLWRVWSKGGRSLVVIGLNPSTADATHDDPTIRRCIGFAKREALDGLIMLNLFALRATDPKVMMGHLDPTGADNDRRLREYAQRQRGIVVAAWGAHGIHHGRAAAVRRMIPGLKCFGLTRDGQPRHPLYLRADTPLVDYPAVPS